MATSGLIECSIGETFYTVVLLGFPNSDNDPTDTMKQLPVQRISAYYLGYKGTHIIMPKLKGAGIMIRCLIY